MAIFHKKQCINKIRPDKPKTTSELTVIIPAAGLSSRLNINYPKCLLEINNKSLLARQIEYYNEYFPGCEIIVPVGDKCESIISKFSGICKFVKNETFSRTNVVHSLHHALLATLNDHVIISYADLIFDKHILNEIEIDNVSKILTCNNYKDNEEIGVSVVDGFAQILEYSFPAKWSQIIYLTGLELRRFRQYVGDEDMATHYGFEAINYCLDHCGPMKVIHTDRKILDIDNSKDLSKARRLFT